MQKVTNYISICYIRHRWLWRKRFEVMWRHPLRELWMAGRAAHISSDSRSASTSSSISYPQCFWKAISMERTTHCGNSRLTTKDKKCEWLAEQSIFHQKVGVHPPAVQCHTANDYETQARGNELQIVENSRLTTILDSNKLLHPCTESMGSMWELWIQLTWWSLFHQMQQICKQGEGGDGKKRRQKANWKANTTSSICFLFPLISIDYKYWERKYKNSQLHLGAYQSYKLNDNFNIEYFITVVESRKLQV